MDTKSLEIRCDSFVSSMYFLKKLGFDTINQENAESLKSSFERKSLNACIVRVQISIIKDIIVMIFIMNGWLVYH